MMAKLMLITLFLSNAVHADDLYFRYQNGTSANASLIDLNMNQSGKLFELGRDFEPWKDRNNFLENIYFQTGAGYSSDIDLNNRLVPLVELSPGAEIQTGPLKLRLSHGFTYFFSKSQQPQFQFGTHFDILLVDAKTGVSLGFERSHYSSGAPATDIHGYSGRNYTGFFLTIPIRN